MLSPAFHVIASAIARCEVGRELDATEMAMGGVDVPPAVRDGCWWEEGDVEGGGGTLLSSSTRREDDSDSPARSSSSHAVTASFEVPENIRRVLKRFNAELNIEIPPTVSTDNDDDDDAANRRMLKYLIFKESLRRGEELVLISDTLQMAMQTAMTLKLNPTSSYLLSFSSTRDIVDESLACATNLSPEDLSGAADIFVSSSSQISSLQQQQLIDAFPKLFFDVAASHNNIFSLILNRRKQQEVAAAAAAASGDGSSLQPPPPPPALSNALDTFTDILNKLLVENDDEDANSSSDEEVGKVENLNDAGGGANSGMQALLESYRRRWSSLFLVWSRWSTAMALAAVNGGGGGSSTSSTAVNIVEILLKRLTSVSYPLFEKGLQQLADDLFGDGQSSVRRPREASTPPPQQSSSASTRKNLNHTTASPPSSAPPALSWIEKKWPPSSLQIDVKLKRKVVLLQSLSRRWLARAVLVPRRMERLFGGRGDALLALLPRAYLTKLCNCYRPSRGRGNRRLSSPSPPPPPSVEQQQQQRQKMGKYFHGVRHESLHKSLLSAYSAQQGTLELYVGATRQLMLDEAKAEDFFANEEANFNAQWKAWNRQMTRAILEETPLDVDWVVQKSPLPSQSVQSAIGQQKQPNSTAAAAAASSSDTDDARNDQQQQQQQQLAKGEFVDPETGLRYQRSYLNTKTGKVQTENPNMLKVIATRNRQLAKANKEREARVNEMHLFVAEKVNGVKQNVLPKLEEQLSAAVYL